MTSEPKKECERCGTADGVQTVSESPPGLIGGLVEVRLCRSCASAYHQWRIDPATERLIPHIRTTPDVKAFLRHGRPHRR